MSAGGLAMEQRMDATLTMQPLHVLIAFSQMLALPAHELRARVEQELALNPALEQEEPTSCLACGAGESEAHLADCEASFAAGERMLTGVQLAEPGMVPEPSRRTTPEAALLAEAQLALSGRARDLATYLVASVDDCGFLAGGPEQVADELGVAKESIDRVLAALRKIGSPAFAARDLRESLLLQLSATTDPAGPICRAIVADHLEALAAGRHSAIAAALGVERAVVVDAAAFLRRRLAPRPAPGFRQVQGGAPRLLPDIVVRDDPAHPGEFEVHAMRPSWARVRVDPGFARLASGASADGAVRDLVRAARSFVARLDQRRSALERIAREVVDRQKAYLRFGPRFLQPLTRADVARRVGLHESTLSRAAAGKHIQLPSGRIVPFADFFDQSQVLADVLQDLLDHEQRPASDQELADSLGALGYHVARRTVTKYRQRLGVPSAAARTAMTPALASESSFA